VTDSGIVAAGHAGRAQEFLEKAGIAVALYDAVRENPDTEDVDRCRQAAVDARVDLFIGLGGGSSVDTAKGANLLLTNGGAVQDYWGVGKVPKPMLPLIAIPTTAGTGSECQSAALIADAVTHQKMACLDPKITARIAILDPELTVSQPARVTAVTGVDALSHALESAVTRRRNVVSWMYSESAFQKLAGGLARVLDEPRDLGARGDMLLGAALAGLAIECSMLGGAHACANPLTARFGVVHGAAVGVMLPAVIRFNAVPGSPSESAYARLAIAAGWSPAGVPVTTAAAALVDGVSRLLDRAGIPRSILDAGVPLAAIPELAAAAARQWTAQFNPRDLDVEAFIGLYTAAAQPRSL
jgi:alcohol dehydrogenase